MIETTDDPRIATQPMTVPGATDRGALFDRLRQRVAELQENAADDDVLLTPSVQHCLRLLTDCVWQVMNVTGLRLEPSYFADGQGGAQVVFQKSGAEKLAVMVAPDGDRLTVLHATPATPVCRQTLRSDPSMLKKLLQAFAQ